LPAPDPVPPVWPAPLATSRRRLVALVAVVAVLGLVAAIVTRGGGGDANGEVNTLAAGSPGERAGAGAATSAPATTAPPAAAVPTTPPSTAPATTAPPTTAATTTLPPTPVPAAAPTPTDGAPLAAGTAGAPGGALCVGDSVMLGASADYQDTLGACTTVDATVSRQMSDGPSAVRAHAPYPDAVVVHLGSNGTVDRADLDALLGELRDVPEVVLVTVQLRGSRSWEGQANGEIAAARARWPNVRVADWKAASDPHPDYTDEDGIHLSRAGARAYAATIAAAL
jgi:hypothetical protein